MLNIFQILPIDGEYGLNFVHAFSKKTLQPNISSNVAYVFFMCMFFLCRTI